MHLDDEPPNNFPDAIDRLSDVWGTAATWTDTKGSRIGLIQQGADAVELTREVADVPLSPARGAGLLSVGTPTRFVTP